MFNWARPGLSLASPYASLLRPRLTLKSRSLASSTSAKAWIWCLNREPETEQNPVQSGFEPPRDKPACPHMKTQRIDFQKAVSAASVHMKEITCLDNGE